MRFSFLLFGNFQIFYEEHNLKISINFLKGNLTPKQFKDVIIKISGKRII